jgi:endonuclease YncB( thermonuclease family)
VNAALVAAGWALADADAAPALGALEAAARQGGRGIWAGGLPGTWRRSR